METIPPVLLGVSLFIPFVLVLALRGPLIRLFVTSALPIAQPKRQFQLDLALCLTAGFTVVLFNTLAYDFPAPSGISLMLGCAVVGFFLAMDMALARERSVIYDTLAEDRVLPPPKRLYSMTRKFSMVALTAILFISLILGLVIARDVVWLVKIEQSGTSIGKAQMSVMREVFFVMAVLLAAIVNLIISYSKNLKLLFENETSVLERVSQGDLSKLVPVATNDEFGIIAGHTNSMIDELKHRFQLIAALRLAEEVQQNLLPDGPPAFHGLDIAGISNYCDETGGDYYDYFRLSNGSLGVVVGDASEHGVSAALLMTTVRALLRQRVAMEGDISKILADVNLELAKDVKETGRFMTLFFLEIEPAGKTLHWVRAGHEPGILYNAQEDSFRELAGNGMALGVVKDLEFQKYTHRGCRPGNVIIVGTDGIRETRNENGEMFGVDRLRERIRKHATESAEDIKNSIIKDLEIFQGKAPQEDDITLVVVKLV